jgi:hypothetical protein
LADSLTTQDLLSCGQKWLACLTPFFKESERKEAGCQHRLFFSQVEYCDNLIFHRRAALDQLGQRLLDANRTIGQPKKITMIFGRKVSHYGKGFLKQYVRDHLCLRTETATNDVTDYGVKKAVENLPQLQDKLATICDNYLTVQGNVSACWRTQNHRRSSMPADGYVVQVSFPLAEQGALLLRQIEVRQDELVALM